MIKASRCSLSAIRKFTLVELLIVIAVLSFLISLLMPSLESAREKTREAVCLSNQKQLFLGFSSFAAQNNNYYPVVYNSVAWDDLISVYLGFNWSDSQKNAFAITDTSYNLEVFLCPSDNIEAAGSDKFRRSYAINEYKPKTTTNHNYFNKALPGIFSHSKDYDNQSINASQAVSPSSLLFIGEQWRNWNQVGSLSAQITGYGYTQLATNPGAGWWKNYLCHGNGRASLTMMDGSATIRKAQSILEGAANINSNDFRGSMLDHLH